MGAAQSVRARLTTFKIGVLSISDFSNTRGLGHALYGTRCSGRVFPDANSMQGFATLMRASPPSHMNPDMVII